MGSQSIRGSYYEPAASKVNKTQSASEKDLKKLDSVCRDLESIFIHTLMKEMRKTVQETKLIDGGPGEEIFRDLLDDEMSKKMAATGDGIGVAKMLYEQLSRPIIAKMKAEQQATLEQTVQGSAMKADEKKD
jgi:peptidoglycan hydrolase FlgJ